MLGRRLLLRIINMNKQLNKIRGFTLMEIILVLMLIVILSGMGAPFLGVTLNAYFQGQSTVNVDTQARVALSRMVNDLHNLSANSSITSATATSFAFTDIAGNTVSYTLSGTQLLRSGILLCDGVSSITFSYYTSNGATLTAPVTGGNLNLIKFVKVTLLLTEKGSTYPFYAGTGLWNTL